MCGAVSRQLVSAGLGGLAQLSASIPVLDHVVLGGYLKFTPKSSKSW